MREPTCFRSPGGLVAGSRVGPQATAPRRPPLGVIEALYGGHKGSPRPRVAVRLLGAHDLGRRFRAGWMKPPFWQISPADGVTIERLYDPEDEPIEISRYTVQLRRHNDAPPGHSDHTDRA